MRNKKPSGNWQIPYEEMRQSGLGPQFIQWAENVRETSVGWNDALIPVGALRTVGVGVPSLDAINSTKCYGWGFTNEGVAGNEKRLQGQVQLSHSVRRGTDIQLHGHFVVDTATTTTAKTVLFNVTYGIIHNTGNVLSTARETTATATITIPAGTPAYSYRISNLATLIDDNTMESSIFWVQIQRNSSSATDDYTGIVYLLSLDAHVVVEKAGSHDAIPVPDRNG